MENANLNPGKCPLILQGFLLSGDVDNIKLIFPEKGPNEYLKWPSKVFWGKPQKDYTPFNKPTPNNPFVLINILLLFSCAANRAFWMP